MALQQSRVSLPERELTTLAGAMLHVNTQTHGSVAARRALSVLDAERQAGRAPSPQLLVHGAAAGALGGLPDLAEALCDEADARGLDPASADSLAYRLPYGC